MKFELVDFYPISKKTRTKSKTIVGTVHLYLIDLNIDLRGIRVNRTKNSIHFLMPHSVAYDDEAKKEVYYPIFSFTKPEQYKEMLDFLHNEVKPIIKERLNAKAKK